MDNNEIISEELKIKVKDDMENITKNLGKLYINLMMNRYEVGRSIDETTIYSLEQMIVCYSNSIYQLVALAITEDKKTYEESKVNILNIINATKDFMKFCDEISKKFEEKKGKLN